MQNCNLLIFCVSISLQDNPRLCYLYWGEFIFLEKNMIRELCCIYDIQIEEVSGENQDCFNHLGLKTTIISCGR